MNSPTAFVPTWKRSIVSAILALHLLLVLSALAANLSSSSIQRKLLNLAQPYLKTFNWQLGLVPIELTHGNEVSDPFFIQVHYEGEPPDRWEKGPWHEGRGEARNRTGRFAQAIAFRAERAKEEIDQEDVVLQLLTSLLKSDRKQRPSSHIDRVRVIREIVYSREQLIMQMQAGENMFPPIAIHFDANVVWISDDEVSLQQQVESRKSSKSIDKPRGKSSSAPGSATGDAP